MPMEWQADDMLTGGQHSPESEPGSPGQTSPPRAGSLGSGLPSEDRSESRSSDVASGLAMSPMNGLTSEYQKRQWRTKFTSLNGKCYQLSHGESSVKDTTKLNHSKLGHHGYTNNSKLFHSQGRCEPDRSKQCEPKFHGVMGNNQHPQLNSPRPDMFCSEPYTSIPNRVPFPENTQVTIPTNHDRNMFERSDRVQDCSLEGEGTGSPTPRAPVVLGGPCQVCGERASGNFFGALVCLPCKSFFIRCTKEGEPVFVTQCDGRCDVSKQGRNRCQHCRYEKCLAAGMSRKEKPEAIEPGEGQLLCRVCGDIANGIHFGVYTCEGCKKFFRRGLLEYQSYVCKGGMCCVLNPRNRNNCRYCRYQKCRCVGMSRGAIKMGRPKKLVQDQDLPSLAANRFGQNRDSERVKEEERVIDTAPVDERVCASRNEETRFVSCSSESNSSLCEEEKSEGSDDCSYSDNSSSSLPIKKCILRSLLTKEEAAFLNAGGDLAKEEPTCLSDDGPHNISGHRSDSSPQSQRLSPANVFGQLPRTVVTGAETVMNLVVDNHDHSSFQNNNLSNHSLKVPTSDTGMFQQRLGEIPSHGPVRSRSHSPSSAFLTRVRDAHDEAPKSKRRKSDNDSPSLPCSPSDFVDNCFHSNNQMTTHSSPHSLSPAKIKTQNQEASVFRIQPVTTATETCLDLSLPNMSSAHTKHDRRQLSGNCNPVTCFPVRTTEHCQPPDLMTDPSQITGRSTQYNSTVGSSRTQAPASSYPGVFMPGHSQVTRAYHSDLRKCESGQGSGSHTSSSVSRLHHTHSYTQITSTMQRPPSPSSNTTLVERSSPSAVNGPKNLSPNTAENAVDRVKDQGYIISREALNDTDNFFLSSLSLVQSIQQRLEKAHRHTESAFKSHFNGSQNSAHCNGFEDIFPQADATAQTDNSKHTRYCYKEPPTLVLPEEIHIAERMKSALRFSPVSMCQYWNSVNSRSSTAQMTREQHQVLQDMLEAYMEMLQNLNEGHIHPNESFSNLKSWPHAETGPIIEHVVRRIVRQVKESLAFTCKVPGFNNFHAKDRLFIIQNMCFANITLMAVRDWYSPETKTFQNVMTWELPEGHPMYRFRNYAKALGEKILQTKMDRTEAAMMSALNVTAADIADLEEPKVIEESREFLMSALATHLSYKGVDPVTRMRELFSLMPAFRLCGFWTKKIREEIAVSKTSNSDNKLKLERLMRENDKTVT